MAIHGRMFIQGGTKLQKYKLIYYKSFEHMSIGSSLISNLIFEQQTYLEKKGGLCRVNVEP